MFFKRYTPVRGPRHCTNGKRLAAVGRTRKCQCSCTPMRTNHHFQGLNIVKGSSGGVPGSRHEHTFDGSR